MYIIYITFSRKLYLGKMKDQLTLICTMQVAMLVLYIAWKAKRASVGEIDDGGYVPEEKHPEYGDFSTLFLELKKDLDLFFRYTRMDVPTFDEL